MAEGRNSRMALSVSRSEAKKKLESQLDSLNKMFEHPMRSKGDYAKASVDFNAWDEYTLDLLRSIFESDSVPNEFASIKHTTAYTGFSADPRLQVKQVAARHWKKLNSVITRLDLYKEPKLTGSNVPYVESGESSDEPAPVTAKPQAESKKTWKDIENEFGMKKTTLGKRINFISDRFKRTVILRDVEQAYVLASTGFSKPAVILAGGVIEELLREYLKYKNIRPTSNTFESYIKACEDKGLLKGGISRLSDSVRCFRNLVHLSKEESKRHTLSKATAKGAVSSIFSIANDFTSNV
jgi:hypothetical protein